MSLTATDLFSPEDRAVRLFAIQHHDPQTGLHLDAERGSAERRDYRAMIYSGFIRRRIRAVTREQQLEAKIRLSCLYGKFQS